MKPKMIIKIGENPGEIQVIGTGSPIQTQPAEDFNEDMGQVTGSSMATIQWSKKNPTCCWINVGGTWYWCCW